jgi:hypothetical protein
VSIEDRVSSVLQDIGVKLPPPPVTCFHCKKKISQAKLKQQRAFKVKESLLYCSTKCLMEVYGEPYNCRTCTTQITSSDGKIQCGHIPMSVGQVPHALSLEDLRIFMQLQLRKGAYVNNGQCVIVDGDMVKQAGSVAAVGFPNSFDSDFVLACSNYMNINNQLQLPFSAHADYLNLRNPRAYNSPLANAYTSNYSWNDPKSELK